MKEDSSKFNIKYLSILAYIGPLFIIGKFSVEKDEEQVKFHCRQGMILFLFAFFFYLVTFLLCLALQGVPEVSEILGLLLYVGGTVAYAFLLLMGLIGAIRGSLKPLPIIGEIGHKTKEKPQSKTLPFPTEKVAHVQKRSSQGSPGRSEHNDEGNP